MEGECWLECPACGYAAEVGPVFDGCVRCNDQSGFPHWLEMCYDVSGWDRDSLSGFGSLPRYSCALPCKEDLRTLGEGGTPLLRLESLNTWVGLPNLWIKWEGGNPTGSFKDRLHAVGIAMGRRLGFRTAFLSSTGNSGVAASAYGLRNGLSVRVRTHPLTPMVSRQAMRAYGAIAGNRVKEPPDSWPCTLMGTFAGRANPFGVEGYKTLAFEVAAQLGRVPDRFCVPVSGGDALYGPYKGFRELVAAGIYGTIPKMTACQSAGADFVVRTLRDGADAMVRLVPSTANLSIADPTGSECIRAAIMSSAGAAWSVEDRLSETAWQHLAAAGLLAENASVVPIAALAEACRQGVIDPEETVVAVVTSRFKKMRKRSV